MNFYDELDDVSFEDLLKIHTGHQNQPPDDNLDNESEEGEKSSSKSQKSDDDYWPTLFTSEQIKANLIDAKDINDKILSTPGIQANVDPKKCLRIARTLITKITKRACGICNEYGANHYMTEYHYDKVLEWIFQQIGTKDEDVISKIFCKICNTGLDGSENHYTTKSHKNCAMLYCAPCKRTFKTSVAKKQHSKSKKHKANQQAFKAAQSSVKSTHSNSQQLTDSKLEINQTFYNDDELSVIPEQLPVQCLTPAAHLEIAKKLQSLLGSATCLICDVNQENKSNDKFNNHFTFKTHIKKVHEWIHKNTKTFGLKQHNPELLYCAACNGVFSTHEIAKAHYESQKHREDAASYCTTCRKFFIKDRKTHRLSVTHKKNVFQTNFTSFADLTSSWPPELAQQTSFSKCGLCQIELEENPFYSYSHYVSKGHEAKVAALLANHKDPESSVAEDAPEGERESEEDPTEEEIESSEEDPSENERESEEDALRTQVFHEIKRAFDKLYFSKSMPPQEALVHLQRLNREIADISKESPLERSTESSILLCEPPPKPRTPIDNNFGQSTKFKLTMELKRLKMVLGRVDLVPPELGVQYASNVIEMIRNLASGEQSINEVEINRLFVVASCELLAWDFEYTKKLRDLDSLESILTSEDCKIDLELGLDVITQFNVQLESSIHDYRHSSWTSDDGTSSESFD